MSGSQPPVRAGAIIVAAGRSERMAGDDKLWLPLHGERPLLAWPLAAYQAATGIDRVVLVVAADAVERARALAAQFDRVCAVVPGGERRRDSVMAGLDALGECEWVSVHDGARPLVTPELIKSGLEEAKETGASCCAVPAHDTVKEAGNDRYVQRTLDRSRVWLAQTPQTFRRDVLIAAHKKSDDDATDDAALVEALGMRVRIYPGSARNIKVTTPEDLALVRGLLAASETLSQR
jgi:2-C-methyl-D-erythritol 4-phosphate cytidylyltransferase